MNILFVLQMCIYGMLSKYGIGAFIFIVVEFVEIISGVPPLETKALILSREQIYLDWLFTLPESLRYNFRRGLC